MLSFVLAFALDRQKTEVQRADHIAVWNSVFGGAFPGRGASNRQLVFYGLQNSAAGQPGRDFTMLLRVCLQKSYPVQKKLRYSKPLKNRGSKPVKHKIEVGFSN